MEIGNWDEFNINLLIYTLDYFEIYYECDGGIKLKRIFCECYGWP